MKPELQAKVKAMTQNMKHQPTIYPDFSPLSHAPFINNAIIPINEHFRVSISYNRSEGLWYAGEKNNYEVAIQVGEGETWELVSFEELLSVNVFCDVSDNYLPFIVEKAKKLIFGPKIEVFASRDGKEKEAWRLRFTCADGYDFKQKLAYCQRVFGEKNVRTA